MSKNKDKSKSTHEMVISAKLLEKKEEFLKKDEVDGWILIKTLKNKTRVFEKNNKFRFGINKYGSYIPMMKVIHKSIGRKDDKTRTNN